MAVLTRGLVAGRLRNPLSVSSLGDWRTRKVIRLPRPFAIASDFNRQRAADIGEARR